MAQVSLHNITKRFGVTEVLHDVSLNIEDGVTFEAWLADKTMCYKSIGYNRSF